ncbi:AsnC family transcriptional regulator [Pokkaliibacter plantistimulans]|uniref:AsnC family transcriptional regulator n=1 Tax=Proteobacteria bacterium 228 TaxID=2083153 RepID=A0A2S5KHE4_9PROT|nr:Lrp/AsnC family transcriptional regulator [Pokkaliibacter plantistimulans]PPC74013.1 AsnC family transcriptional regulator [Pokkaliibacter plantistimulans]
MENTGVVLDDTDIAILIELHNDGRMLNSVLAARLGLAASSCLRRVRRLEQQRLLVRYCAQLDLSKITDTLLVFSKITLSDHRSIDYLRFEKGMQQIDEAMECHLVSAGFDYLVRFQVKDISHYQQVMDHLIDQDLGIACNRSHIVMRSAVARTHQPLQLLVQR